MKLRALLTLLLLLPLISLAQNKKPREILRGHIIADSLSVADITVQNSTSRISAVTDTNGYFTLYARSGDTLFVNSITFRSQFLVLKDSHMQENPLTLKMDVNVTTLDEVVITPLTGDLGYDTKKTKVAALNPHVTPEQLKYDYPISKRPVNGALPVTESALQGIDFKAIYKMIFKPKKKKQDKGVIDGTPNTKTFSEVVSGRFTHYFFTETLKIPHNEIGAFLTFCDQGKETRPLLDPRKEFELTDYLVGKANEYLKRNKG
ncbi:hypothetical protein ACLI1A_00650 [Flavobacterium sp. RHBU_3]|uniref:hypothetical protein n=1 Tax=Flavobacterium sp. RHBU_3 TaxID=3391184 RepID=UPI0039851A56